MGGKKPFVPSSDTASLKVGDVGSGLAKNEIIGVIHKTEITLKNLVITMTDAGAAGSHGSKKIYDFPEGVIQILNAICNLTTLAGAGGIGDTAALVGSVGTVTTGTGDATLTTTEADIIASIIGTLTGGAGVLKGFGPAPAIAFDGTTTPVDAFLNLAVPDAGSSANDTITVNGTISIWWIGIGDY